MYSHLEIKSLEAKLAEACSQSPVLNMNGLKGGLMLSLNHPKPLSSWTSVAMERSVYTMAGAFHLIRTGAGFDFPLATKWLS